MRKLFIYLKLLIVSIFLIQCSKSEDEIDQPYTAYSHLPSELIGTWRYKITGSTNIDAVITFTNSPNINLKINNYTYSGKPYYLTSGGDGSIYFKIEGKQSYSKLSYKYNSQLPYLIQFKIENVESYMIDKTFQKD